MTIDFDEQEALLTISALTEYARSVLPSIARIVPGKGGAIEVAMARAVLLRRKIESALPPLQPALPLAQPALPPESPS